MIHLRLNREVMSQNKRDRMHWSKRHEDRNAWIMLLGFAYGGRPPRPVGRMHVLIESFRARLITDNANLRGGAKGLLDALKQAGYIIDDSDEMVDIQYRQQQAKVADRCTMVSVWPVKS